jgi:hypothetical protein
MVPSGVHWFTIPLGFQGESVSGIDIDRTAVCTLGRTFAGTGDDVVGRGATQVENGWVPNVELACRSMWLTCQGAWSATFSRQSSTVSSTGHKLQTAANVVGNSDSAGAEQFRPVVNTEPTYVPGANGGRYYR